MLSRYEHQDAQFQAKCATAIQIIRESFCALL